jgi:hypothetical protein
MEFWIHGVTPEPFGLRATVLERDAAGWRCRSFRGRKTPPPNPLFRPFCRDFRRGKRIIRQKAPESARNRMQLPQGAANLKTAPHARNPDVRRSL